ncbi:hypothetical protein [Gynuella sp.]|uniref:hypothetical protein n=1 Tax=Gynuella sp. TaxID=2969146 RepID=UPI003D0C2EBC
MKKIRSFALACVLLCPVFAFSGTIENATIKRLEMSKSQENWVLIDMDGSKSDCTVLASWDFALKTDTDYGKQMLSLLMSAYIAGKKVTLIGYSSPVCGYLGIEELDKIRTVK